MAIPGVARSNDVYFDSQSLREYDYYYNQVIAEFKKKKYDSAIQILQDQLIPLSKKMDEDKKALANKLLSTVKYMKFNTLGEDCSKGHDYIGAIENFSLALQDAQFLDVNIKSSSYSNLAISFIDNAQYPEADENLQAADSLLKDIKDQTRKEEAEALIHHAYGRLYKRTGEYHKAIERCSKELGILQKLNNKQSEAKAYGNIGLCYLELGEIAETHHDKTNALEHYNKAKEYFKKDKQLCLELKQPEEVWEASINIGNCDIRLGTSESLAEAEQCFQEIITNTKNPGTKVKAETGLANILFYQEKYENFRNYYGTLAVENIPLQRRGEIRYNLGLANLKLNKLDEAKHALEQSIEDFANLQQKQHREEWQISIFEKLKQPFCQLEEVLIKQEYEENAMKVVDARLARALQMTLLRKLDPSKSLPSLSQIYGIDYKSLAHIHKTTFVVYSLTSDGTQLRIWIVSAENIQMEVKDITGLKDQISSFSDSVKSITWNLRNKVRAALDELLAENKPALTVDDLIDNPQKMDQIRQISDKSPIELETALTEVREALRKMNEQLEKWYEDLIPQTLKDRKPENITVVADQDISKIPFAALRYKRDDGSIRYLIEDSSVSTAPSISILDSLSKKSSDSEQRGLIIGDPKEDLLWSIKEIDSLKDLMDETNIATKVLRQKNAALNLVIGSLTPIYRYIHISCHGTDLKSKHPNALFAGALQFADIEDPYLYSEDISLQTISAEIVFMSACCSGVGKIYQEGNVGLIWAFLAAGAKTVVASHWILYDNELTINIVKDFYSQVFQGENKAKALQHAVCKGLVNNRDRPDKWGLFYLSGLNNEVEVPKQQKFSIQTTQSDSAVSEYDLFG